MMKAPGWSRFATWVERAVHRRRVPSLPPGDPIPLDLEERSDRLILLDLATRHGPIFKGRLEDGLGICIVGLALGRRFLAEHAERIQAANIDISRVVSAGFMRQMQSETHRHYRRILMAALSARPEGGGFTVDDAVTRRIMAREVDRYADAGDTSPESWQRALQSLMTQVLVAVLTGIDPTSRSGRGLSAAYDRLGRFGLVWNLTQAQITAFAEIRSLLERAIAADEVAPASLLGRLVVQPGFDATMLGNLVYMIEMGRYDMQTFFRWLSRYAAVHRTALQRAAGAAPDGAPLMRSFVLEVLRADQSERLMRRCLIDLEFDGFLFPKDTLVRICMWESHHDPGRFAAPLQFQPDRFASGESLHDRFSPFGLDRHACPFGELVIRLATTFLDVLSTREIQAEGDGAPIRGAYHWEPATSFSLRIGAGATR